MSFCHTGIEAQRISNLVNLLRVSFGMFRDDDDHFVRADSSRRRMRMVNFTGSEIFRMLLDELDYTIASGFEMRGSVSKSGETSPRPAGFR